MSPRFTSTASALAGATERQPISHRSAAFHSRMRSDHREAGEARAVALGAAMPQLHGGGGALNGIGGSQANPVLSREVVEGLQNGSILMGRLPGWGHR